MPNPHTKQVQTDTVPFGGALSSADDSAQKALETLDRAVPKGDRNTVQTTDATVTTIATIAIPDDTVVEVTVTVVGRRTDAAQRGAFVRQATVFRENPGAATLSGNVTTTRTRPNGTPWKVTLIVSGNNLLVQVQGEAAKTVNWKSQHSVVEVA